MNSEEEKKMTDQDLIRSRQRSRALAMGVVLGALVILIYAIAIAKMTGGG